MVMGMSMPPGAGAALDFGLRSAPFGRSKADNAIVALGHLIVKVTGNEMLVPDILEFRFYLPAYIHDSRAASAEIAALGRICR